MPSYVNTQYAKLITRRDRVAAFFADLDSELLTLGVQPISHQDIYWDGNFVRVKLTDTKLASEIPSVQLKYFNQGLGLMKLAFNSDLYA